MLALACQSSCVLTRISRFRLWASFLRFWLRSISFTNSDSNDIWRLALGVGWGSGPLGAATRCPRRRRPFHFFFATWPFLAIRNVRVLPDTTDDGRTTKPGSPQTPLLRTENRQIFIAKFFFSKKNFGAKIFLAILKIRIL